MKSLVLGAILFVSGSAMAQDAASAFVQTTANKVEAILKAGSTSSIESQFCSLAKTLLDKDSIANVWLGDYEQEASDQSGVTAFTNLVPSILVSDIMQKLPSGGVQGSVQVDSSSTNNGDGTYSVGVTVTSSGSSYSGNVILMKSGSTFLFEDATYLGFSGVSYLGQSYQQDLENDNSATPVTDLVQTIKTSSGFVNCD